jgi:hypothetical protein
MLIQQLQTEMKPWTVEPHFENNPDPAFMFKHALFHATKATGKIAGAADDHDHNGAKIDPAVSFHECNKYLADLVICAMKMASEASIDLQKAVEFRMREKGLL